MSLHSHITVVVRMAIHDNTTHSSLLRLRFLHLGDNCCLLACLVTPCSGWGWLEHFVNNVLWFNVTGARQRNTAVLSLCATRNIGALWARRIRLVRQWVGGWGGIWFGVTIKNPITMNFYETSTLFGIVERCVRKFRLKANFFLKIVKQTFLRAIIAINWATMV